MYKNPARVKAKSSPGLSLIGKEYNGSITVIEPYHFEIAEVDLKQRMTFDYKDVKKA
jgi:hypothetical protein